MKVYELSFRIEDNSDDEDLEVWIATNHPIRLTKFSDAHTIKEIGINESEVGVDIIID